MSISDKDSDIEAHIDEIPVPISIPTPTPTPTKNNHITPKTVKNVDFNIDLDQDIYGIMKDTIDFNTKKIIQNNNENTLDDNIDYDIENNTRNNAKNLNYDDEVEIKTDISNIALGTLEDIENYAKDKRNMHEMASKFYSKKHRKYYIPSQLITFGSGILSFLASSSFFNEQNIQIMTITVGCMASLATLIQSFSNQYGYSNKSESHQNAVEALDQLNTKITFYRKKHGDEIEPRFIEELYTQIMEIKQRCKYLIPDEIEHNYIKKKYEKHTNSILYQAKEEALKVRMVSYMKKIAWLSDRFDKMYHERVKNLSQTELDNKKMSLNHNIQMISLTDIDKQLGLPNGGALSRNKKSKI